jgi:hypothetical protein
MSKMRKVFSFLADAYRNKGGEATRFATDQTHFYTLATTLLGTNILDVYEYADLAVGMVDFDTVLTNPSKWRIPGLRRPLAQYQELSTRQTSDSTKRADRQKYFEEVIGLLIIAKGGKEKTQPTV